MKNQKILSLLFLLLVIMFGGCGGEKKPLVSQSQMNDANSRNAIVALYDKVSENIKADKKALLSAKQAIVAKAYQFEKSILDISFSQLGESDFVSRSQLNAMREKFNYIKDWSQNDYVLLSNQVVSQINRTNDSISSWLELASQEIDTIKRLELLEKTANLAGQGEVEYENYQQSKAIVLEELADEGESALNNRLFDKAKETAKIALKISNDSIQFNALMQQAEAGLFEKSFSLALESGKPESAYHALVELADKDTFQQLKLKMENSFLLLANYFADTGKQMSTNSALLEAYNNFEKGRNIQRILGMPQLGFAQEKVYINQLITQANSATKFPGKQLVLYRVVQELDPSYPKLEEKITLVTETIKKRAVTKLAIKDFKEISTTSNILSSVGRRIATQMEQKLLQQMGNEISIVVNDNALQKEASAFEGTFLKVDGEVLQAAIETGKNKGSRIKNVITQVQKDETEEYAQWKKRKRGEAPKQFNETPIYEDITLTVEHINKSAILEVAFRIIEPESGSIILAESFSENEEFSGESINEIQKGVFHQPFQKANLPSDIMIVDNLSSELAEKLTQKIGGYLGNIEQAFYNLHIQMLEKQKNADAIETLANALVIAENKAVAVERPDSLKLWYHELRKLGLN